MSHPFFPLGQGIFWTQCLCFSSRPVASKSQKPSYLHLPLTVLGSLVDVAMSSIVHSCWGSKSSSSCSQSNLSTPKKWCSTSMYKLSWLVLSPGNWRKRYYWLEDLYGCPNFCPNDGFWVSSMRPVSQTKRKQDKEVQFGSSQPWFQKHETLKEYPTVEEYTNCWRCRLSKMPFYAIFNFLNSFTGEPLLHPVSR